MTTAKNEIMQMEYRNPDATQPLYVPVLVICNTPDELLANNIRTNSAKDLKWLRALEPNTSPAVMVGGGPSAKDHLNDIIRLRNQGATVFAMNAASKWLHENGIDVDYQCILDAKEETADLVDPDAKDHLFGSQVHPKTMGAVDDPIVWHVGTEDIEQFFPEERKKRGGYALTGGGAAVGNSALCAAYALGFRQFEIFGYDSSHRDNDSHAYEQPMNRFIPVVDVEWAGKKYKCSVAMKAQAEKFQLTAHSLKEAGAEVNVHGDGLLPAMYYTEYGDLTEREKYQLMWQFDTYRTTSPGELIADVYCETFKPEGKIIDYGCGTGRAGIKFRERGHDVLLIDFTDNCRDKEAQEIPFLQWDLTQAMPVSAPNGFCTDVMEHIPTDDVDTVIDNIMGSSEKVFFQISTIDDSLGELINEPLHLTVKPLDWWAEKFTASGYEVAWCHDLGAAALFYITRPNHQ